MSEQDGGPAFPSLEVYESYNRDLSRYEVKSDTATGMSLRDYFAAHVAGSLAGQLDPRDAAYEAYQRADAMLKVRVAKR